MALINSVVSFFRDCTPLSSGMKFRFCEFVIDHYGDSSYNVDFEGRLPHNKLFDFTIYIKQLMERRYIIKIQSAVTNEDKRVYLRLLIQKRPERQRRRKVIIKSATFVRSVQSSGSWEDIDTSSGLSEASSSQESNNCQSNGSCPSSNDNGTKSLKTNKDETNKGEKKTKYPGFGYVESTVPQCSSEAIEQTPCSIKFERAASTDSDLIAISKSYPQTIPVENDELSKIISERDVLKGRCKELSKESSSKSDEVTRLQSDLASMKEKTDRLIKFAIDTQKGYDEQYSSDKPGNLKTKKYYRSRYESQYKTKLGRVTPTSIKFFKNITKGKTFIETSNAFLSLLEFGDWHVKAIQSVQRIIEMILPEEEDFAGMLEDLILPVLYTEGQDVY